MMATGSSAAKGNPHGTVRRAAAGVGAQHSHVLLVPTGDDHTGVASNWGIPEGAGQTIWTVPVDPDIRPNIIPCDVQHLHSIITCRWLKLVTMS